MAGSNKDEDNVDCLFEKLQQRPCCFLQQEKPRYKFDYVVVKSSEIGLYSLYNNCQVIFMLFTLFSLDLFLLLSGRNWTGFIPH